MAKESPSPEVVADALVVADGDGVSQNGFGVKQVSVFCVNTEHGGATIFCTDCRETYCRPCASYHEVVQSMIGGHRVKQAAEMSSAEVEQAREMYNKTCSEHELPFALHCNTCQLLLCAKCAARRHKDHHCEELSQSAHSAHLELEQVTQNSASYITRQNDALAELKNTEGKIRLNVKDAKADLKATSERLRHILDEYERAISRKLEDFEADALQKVHALRRETEANIDSARRNRRDVDSLRDSSSPIAAIVHVSQMKRQLQEQAEAQKTIDWKVVSETKQQGKNSVQAMLGTVGLKSFDTIVPGGSTMQKPLRSVSLTYEGNRVVIGMVVIGDCLCVVHDGESRLWLYDMTRGRCKACDIPGLGCTRGMAVLKLGGRTLSQSDWSLEGLSTTNCQVEATGVVSVAGREASGSLVITDQCGSGCELHFVDVSPSELTISDHRVKNIPLKNPTSVSAARKSGQLLIGQNGTAEFAICNKEGDVLKKVKVSGAAGSVKCVSETRDGYVTLVWQDGGRCVIHWLDKLGNSHHVYGHNQEEHLKRSFSIQDRTGCLVVADRGNNRLHLVNGNGRLAESLLTEEAGICAPQCLYLDEGRGRLYLAHGRPGSQEVLVYEWPARSIDTSVTSLELNVQLGSFC